jgi:hypothetical protein
MTRRAGDFASPPPSGRTTNRRPKTGPFSRRMNAIVPARFDAAAWLAAEPADN